MHKNQIAIIVAIPVLLLAFVMVKMYSGKGHDDRLNGIWKVEWSQVNGHSKLPDRSLWVIRGRTLTVVRDDSLQKLALVTDPTKSPPHFDTDHFFWPRGIYRIDGDELLVAQSVPQARRPTDLTTTMGDVRAITSLTRLHVGSPPTSEAELSQLLQSVFGPPPPDVEPRDFDPDAEEFVAELMRDLYEREDRLSPKEQALYDVSWLMTEVNNGGLHQFFYNSTGDRAAETAQHLRLIGAPQTAAMVDAGCALFPGGKPSRDLDHRRRQLDEFSPEQGQALEGLTEEFYTREEDLGVLLRRYWQK